MDKIEQKILNLIDSKAEQIINFAEDVYHSAEASFCEWKTAEKVSKFFHSLDLPVKENIALTEMCIRDRSYLI